MKNFSDLESMLNEEINANTLRNEYLLENFDKNAKFEEELKAL
jgi:hypothetical protein